MRRKASGLARQEPPGRLPAELVEFLSRETYSLLIKGVSGTGKSILALTILGKFKANENILYLSTRTSPLQLAKDHPWIADVAGLSAEPSVGGTPEEGWETLVDARLDEPGVVFERITNVLMDKHAPTVVVDSWEALSESMDEEALRTNIRVLQTWRERAGARLIFIGEDSANTAIDSVVDGVVTLSERVFSGRRLREIFLSKLHGVKIPKPSYFFSLEGGVFHSFERYSQSGFGLAGQSPFREARIRGGDKRHHSSGFRPLDDALEGGYPSKSAAWIETDPRVDSRVVLAFLSGMIREWAASGGSVVLQKSDGVDISSATQLRALGGGDSKRFKVWETSSRGKKTRVDDIAGLRSKVAEAGRPVLSIVDMDEFTSASSTSADVLGSVVDFLKRSAELTILVSRSRPAQHPFPAVVSTHIKILDIDGTLFLMSEKPWSELYAMVPERPDGNPGVQLERVV